MFSKTASILVGFALLLLGTALGIVISLNFPKIVNLLTSATPRPSPTTCEIQSFTNLGLSLCLPKNWIVRQDEGSKRLQLGKVILQSADFDQVTDSSLDGLPVININHGYQLSITASRLTTGSNIATYSALKDFWKINKSGHSISRQEEKTINGLPALYHVLLGPKVGHQIDTHFIKSPILYDINFFFSPDDSAKGEDLFRSILDQIILSDVDLKIIVSDQLKIVSPKDRSVLPSKSLKIEVSAVGLGITSQSELPTLILKSVNDGPATILGTAQPIIASDSAGLATTTSFSFNWLFPDYGTYDLFTEVIKNNGQIYRSVPSKITIATKK